MPAKPKADWIAIEGEYRAGKRSIVQIAADHGISEAAIRKRAKAGGWLRDPEGTKRERVKALMSGVGSDEGAKFASRTIEEEALADKRDMDLGLEVARRVLYRLLETTEIVSDPKDLKVIAEANKIAVETIRRIRNLDDPPDAKGDRSPALDINRFFSDLLRRPEAEDQLA